MNALDLARWKFGITTIHHFLLMPLSIGLSLLIAIMQTGCFPYRAPWSLVSVGSGSGAGRLESPPTPGDLPGG
jgi:Cytochrome bd terminal oxidase subunit I